MELVRGETAASPRRLRDVLAGVRRYQQAERVARPPVMPRIAQVGRASLRDYGGDGPPVMFIPSLINPPYVLDMGENNSLLRWLSRQGVRPLLLDWGEPTAVERGLSIAGHVETYLLPLIDRLGERPALVGYCLGGTMAIAAAMLADVTALVTIATPWRFDAFSDDARAGLAGLWQHASPSVEMLGLLPMEVLQSIFWRLDPARTVAKFETLGNAEVSPVSLQAFVTLEDWANDGPPLTLAAARELMIDLFRDDRTGLGQWHVGDRDIKPERISCPGLDIVSTSDRIVPAASAPGLRESRALTSGHVGMIVGGRAPDLLWRPLALWLKAATVRR